VETTPETKMNYPALTAENTKAEIVNHLSEVHHRGHGFNVSGQHVGDQTTKVTKSQLLTYHERLHKALDSDTRTHSDQYGRTDMDHWYADFDDNGHKYRASARVPTYDHVHTAAVISDEIREAANRVRNNEPVSDKPLSAQERRVLTELVNNDFAALKAEMQAFAADSLQQTRNEVEAEWQAKIQKSNSLVVKANELRRKATAEMRALTDKHNAAHEEMLRQAKDAGIEFKESERWENNQKVRFYEADAVGRREALQEAEKDNKRFLDRALMTLERQRLDAQRRVLVSGVSKEAAGILDAIPDAKSMMIDAQKTEPTRQITG
jgi:hypothetical protein